MIVLKANYWEYYLSSMASAEEMRVAYNAKMSCVNMGTYILNSSESLSFFFLTESFLIPLPSQRRRKPMFLSHVFLY